MLEGIPKNLMSFIKTRDKKSNVYHYRKDEISFLFNELLTKGEIKTGGRSTCGKHVDNSWKTFTMFNEVITKAKKIGYKIEVVHIKQDCKYATLAGGFWHENLYKLKGNYET